MRNGSKGSSRRNPGIPRVGLPAFPFLKKIGHVGPHPIGTTVHSRGPHNSKWPLEAAVCSRGGNIQVSIVGNGKPSLEQPLLAPPPPLAITTVYTCFLCRRISLKSDLPLHFFPALSPSPPHSGQEVTSIPSPSPKTVTYTAPSPLLSCTGLWGLLLPQTCTFPAFSLPQKNLETNQKKRNKTTKNALWKQRHFACSLGDSRPSRFTSLRPCRIVRPRDRLCLSVSLFPRLSVSLFKPPDTLGFGICSLYPPAPQDCALDRSVPTHSRKLFHHRRLGASLESWIFGGLFQAARPARSRLVDLARLPFSADRTLRSHKRSGVERF